MIGTGGRPATIPEATYEAPYGNTLVGTYAMAARRHMHEYGTTSEQLAEIAVITRRHAMLNPLAMYREPITVQDVLNSRMIADPPHLLDCCVVSDGGGAVLVTTEERARDLKQKPVFVLESSESHTHAHISQMPDMTVTAAAITAPRAFAEAGISPSDIDMAMIYDSFTITVLLLLEDLGFCKKGEGSLRAGGTHRFGRTITRQYRWGRAIIQPSRHARYLSDYRGYTPVARPMRTSSGGRSETGGSSW